MIFFGLLYLISLAATSPPVNPISRLKEPLNEIVEKRSKVIALGTFFWFLLILMLILIVLGFLNSLK